MSEKLLTEIKETQQKVLFILEGPTGNDGLVDDVKALKTQVSDWIIPMARIKDVGGFAFWLIRMAALAALVGIGTLLWETIKLGGAL
jgi:hypothetical protein